MKGINPLLLYLGVLAIIGLAATGGLKSGKLFSVSGAGLEEAVFCNTYEFQSCGMHKDFSGTLQVIQHSLFFDQYKGFTCGYDECRLIVFVSSSISNPQIYLTVTTPKGVKGGISVPGTIYFGDLLETNGGDISISYDAYQRRLAWCGSAACDAGVTGINVIGSDKCTFTTDKTIYDKNGLVTKPAAAGGQSYTVPVTESIQIFNGQQFICGTKFSQCTIDTDCAAGHTYQYGNLGAEASAGTLQVYGCVSGGTAPTQLQLDILPSLRPATTATTYSYGNRCQIKQTVSVQCIPGSASCGSNAVCDVSTFTCKQAAQVKCTQDRDCGVGEVYDQPAKSYYSYSCLNAGTPLSYCNRNLLRTVECKYNSECAANSYCDIDSKCKQSVNPSQSCPTACCSNDPRYFDKPAPAGQICCPGGQLFAPSLSQCTGGGGSGGGGLGIFEMLVIIFLLVGAIVILPKLLDIIPHR